ncbi:MAG: TIM-barrel domain-containing protein [Alistipes communis]
MDGRLYGRLRAAAPERRPLLFTRSAFAGQQRYGTAVWSGDIIASWETMKRQLAAGVNLRGVGIPLLDLRHGRILRHRQRRHLPPRTGRSGL